MQRNTNKYPSTVEAAFWGLKSTKMVESSSRVNEPTQQDKRSVQKLVYTYIIDTETHMH